MQLNSTVNELSTISERGHRQARATTVGAFFSWSGPRARLAETFWRRGYLACEAPRLTTPYVAPTPAHDPTREHYLTTPRVRVPSGGSTTYMLVKNARVIAVLNARAQQHETPRAGSQRSTSLSEDWTAVPRY